MLPEVVTKPVLIILLAFNVPLHVLVSDGISDSSQVYAVEIFVLLILALIAMSWSIIVPSWICELFIVPEFMYKPETFPTLDSNIFLFDPLNVKSIV